MIELHKPIPVLRIFSVEKAREFYCGFLGFEEDWQHGGDSAPVYLQMRRSEAVLHLSEHYGDGTPGSVVFIPMKDVRGYCDELLAKNYRYYRPGVARMEYGADVMEVIDPFGNRIRFAEFFNREQ